MNYVIFPDGVGKVTEKAFQVRMDSDLIWLPKSQTKAQVREVNGFKEYRVILPYWLADEKGFFARSYNGSNVYLIQSTEEHL
jgi:hypothetical protein